MGRVIAFNEESLRYFLYTLSCHILESYVDLIPDEEDLRVIEEIVQNDLRCLIRAVEKKGDL